MTTTRAAQVLLHPDERFFLEPFLGRELTVGQAARELDRPVEQVAYRVRTMATKGLLDITGALPRKGRAMTLYRGPEEVRAPLELLPYEDVRGFFALVDAGMRESFLANLAGLADRAGLRDWVVRLYRAADDGVRLDLAPSGGTWDPAVLLSDQVPAVVFNWVPLTLTRQEAKQLQREMTQLIGRYQGGAAGAPHVMGLFLTPSSASR